MLRAHLIRLSGTEHVLLIVVHHAVFDGWSAGVFLRDLAALYHAEVTGTPPGLPELAIQFADYALWERDRLAGPATAGLDDYWRQVMHGFPTVPFPTDRPRPRTDDFDGGLVTRTTSPALLAGLRELSRAARHHPLRHPAGRPARRPAPLHRRQTTSSSAPSAPTAAAPSSPR